MKIVERLIEKFGIEAINKEGLNAILNYVEDNVGINNVLEIILDGPRHIEYNEEKVKDVLKHRGYDVVSIIKYEEKPVEQVLHVNFTKYQERYFANIADKGDGYCYKNEDHPFAKNIIVKDYDNISYNDLA